MKPDYEVVGCPVCGHAPNEIWLDDGKPTRYLRCLICGTVFASPRAPLALRRTWLDTTFSMTDDVLELTESRRPALEREAKLIQKHIQSGRMLDVGCSIGTLFEFFEAKSWNRKGVELSPSAADYAIKTYDVEVFTGALQEAKYAKSHFDLITLIDTLYYLDDPAAYIDEIYKLLKPGGWLAIEIAGQSYMHWRNYGLVPWLLDKRWSRATTDSSYLYWFGPQGLNQLLKKGGFQTFAWYVIPSPRHGNVLVDALTGFHYSVLKSLSRLSFKALTWAPKYLCLARRTEELA